MAKPSGFTGPNIEGGTPVIKATSVSGVADEVIGTVRKNMEANDEWYDMGNGEFDEGIYKRWMGGLTERYQQEGVRLAIRRANPDNKDDLMAMQIPLKPKPVAPTPAPAVKDADPDAPVVDKGDLGPGGGEGKEEAVTDASLMAQALAELEVPEVPDQEVTAITNEINYHNKWIQELGAGEDGQLDFGARAALLGKVTLRSFVKGGITGAVSGGVSFGIDKLTKTALKNFKGAPHVGGIISGAMTTYSWFGNGGAGAKKKWAAIAGGADKVFNKENWSKRPLATTADLFHWLGDIIGTIGDICSMLSMACYVIAGLGFLLSLIPGLQPIAAIVAPCVNGGKILNSISTLCGPVAKGANLLATAFRAAAILVEASDPTEMSEQLALYEGEMTGLVQSVTTATTKKKLSDKFPDAPATPTPAGDEPPEPQKQPDGWMKTAKDEFLKGIGITFKSDGEGPWYKNAEYLKSQRDGLSTAWNDRDAVSARIKSMYGQIDDKESEAGAVDSSAMNRGKARINEGKNQLRELYGDAYRTTSASDLTDEKQAEMAKKGQTEIYTADTKAEDIKKGPVSLTPGGNSAQRRKYRRKHQRSGAWQESERLKGERDAIEDSRIAKEIVDPYWEARDLTPGAGGYSYGLKKPANEAIKANMAADKHEETPSDKAKRELEEFLGERAPKTDAELAEAADKRSGFQKFAYGLADKGIAGNLSELTFKGVDHGLNSITEMTGARWVPSGDNMKFMAAKLPAPPEKDPWVPIGQLQEDIADRDAAMGMMIKALDTNDKNAADSVESAKEIATLDENRQQTMVQNNEKFAKQIEDKETKAKEAQTKGDEAASQQKGGPTAQMKDKFTLVRGILATIKGGVDGVNKIPGLNTTSTSKNIGSMIQGIDGFTDGEKSTAGNKGKQDGEVAKNKEGISKAKAKSEQAAQQASDYESLLLDKMNNEKEYQTFINQESESLMAKFSEVKAERETKMLEWSEKKNALKTWAMDHFQKRVEAGYGEDVKPPKKEEAQQEALGDYNINTATLAELRGHPGYARAHMLAMNRA